MSQHFFDDAKFSMASASSNSCSSQSPSSSCLSCRHTNVFQSLACREISSQPRCSLKRLQWQTAKCGSNCKEIDARHELNSWVEAKSLHHLSAKYCPLSPPPRSTIAAAFSLDGKTIASTHGDHTVKIIDCQTGRCLKILSGHRRTPWVVRFHPLCTEILASGSLDHEVRLWDAQSAVCIGSHDFNRPIASIAFHAQGELLAVASGHKLFMWNYGNKEKASSPSIVLKTKRSLRAVHFHPHGAPLLLTAEINDLDSPDSPLTYASSSGYSPYPPPAVFFASINSDLRAQLEANLSLIPSPYYFWPTFIRDEGSSSFNIGGNAEAYNNQQTNIGNQLANLVTPMEMSPNPSICVDLQTLLRNIEEGQLHQFVPVSDATRWELPFLHGWLMGQTHGSSHSNYPSINQSRVSGRCSSRHHRSRSRVIASTASGEAATNGQNSEIAGLEIPTSLNVPIVSSESPCTVKLRIWLHNIQEPCSPLDADKCCLIVPHAVLCSEMGAHFSPCGRFFVACIACKLPQMESDPGPHAHILHDAAGASPTRHPMPSHQVVYELRVYSLEKATFGTVLASRAIRAAHCLTSIQFSPTSEHILLAYGRRHNSLLRSIVVDEETAIPIYTILEVYRVSDMELVRVLPSAEDEVNVACFHPLIGGGLVYGTKEGKLRILQFDGFQEAN